MDAVKGDVLPRPDNVAVKIQCGQTAPVESDVDEFPIGYGCGSGLRVFGSRLLGHLAHHLLVPEQFAVAGVETERRQDSPCSVAVVRNRRLPHTTGDDQPTPGTSTCQARFSLRLQVNGKPVSLETPCPVGPRKHGQFSAAQGAVSHTITNAATLRIPGCHHVVMSVLIRSFAAVSVHG